MQRAERVLCRCLVMREWAVEVICRWNTSLIILDFICLLKIDLHMLYTMKELALLSAAF